MHLSDLTEEDAARLAVPGDPNLTFDVAGLTLTGVVYEDMTLGDDRVLFRLGHPTERVETLDFTVDYERSDDGVDYFQPAYRLLCEWRDNKVPVRVCSAPGRVSTIIGGGGHTFLPLALTS